MGKIKMTTPLVEMDGDEMTRVLWAMIKEKLILPFVDLKTEYYDLGLLHRNETQELNSHAHIIHRHSLLQRRGGAARHLSQDGGAHRPSASGG